MLAKYEQSAMTFYDFSHDMTLLVTKKSK
jgi:hypothetical protein